MVSSQLKKGATPLYIAAQEGYKSLVAKLIKHKANVNMRAHVRRMIIARQTILSPLDHHCRQLHQHQQYTAVRPNPRPTDP